MREDWELLLTFLPKGWAEMASKLGAVKGLRKDKSPDKLLRVLLIHIGCGYSLRETVIRAKKAQLGDLSDVALLKRLRKCKEWLLEMCVALFNERGVQLLSNPGFQMRTFDATTVKEPGATGSLWRIHYSVSLPSLSCDFFKLTETKGAGTGESFKQFPVNSGDYILADRGYSTPSGVEYVTEQGAYVTVRVNTASLPLQTLEGKPFGLLKKLGTLQCTHSSGSWPAITHEKGSHKTQGRICAIRKSEEAIQIAHDKLKRNASKKGTKLQPETLEYAKYVILFTTFPENNFSCEEVLEWYRMRWQVELVFKRFKSLAELGHLPKYDDDSSKAWLYGKLLVALLAEKLAEYASFFSPWGYVLEQKTAQKCLA
ncbi:MAG: IS4 family transposase [Chlamydiales bacterium]|nr:IS4 family transposase [Chlamydiales bacterium]